MFFWSYNNDPDNIYVVRFDGLTEYFAFNTTYYLHKFTANSTIFDQIIKEELEQPRGMFPVSLLRDLIMLREIMSDIVRAWGHPSTYPSATANGWRTWPI